jgi:hypothetical protein
MCITNDGSGTDLDPIVISGAKRKRKELDPITNDGSGTDRDPIVIKDDNPPAVMRHTGERPWKQPGNREYVSEYGEPKKTRRNVKYDAIKENGYAIVLVHGQNGETLVGEYTFTQTSTNPSGIWFKKTAPNMRDLVAAKEGDLFKTTGKAKESQLEYSDCT